jgi:hypothetical protein
MGIHVKVRVGVECLRSAGSARCGEYTVPNTVPYFNCRRFCAEKAFDFNKSQQLSKSGVQQVQYQSVRNNKFQ